ncbi:MAG: hypothetical protein SFY69_09840 [Planctomycetota bacterium]|nr:hypothetical protein [Planctomycetota bacterium]
MGCLLAAVAFFLPRFVIILLVITGDYIGRAYETWFWPLLGFLFMPYTTLAYAASVNEGGGVHGWWWAVMAVAVMLDLSSNGGGERARRLKKRKD